eukprot:scaffold986_cov237-Pinguiococcus_pyrenoidosus.AAC.32
MTKVFDAYATRKSLSRQNLRFMLDGDRIPDDATPKVRSAHAPTPRILPKSLNLPRWRLLFFPPLTCFSDAGAQRRGPDRLHAGADWRPMLRLPCGEKRRAFPPVRHGVTARGKL